MSFIAKSFFSFFNSYSNNQKPKEEKNLNQNNNNNEKFQNLFIEQKSSNRTKIFTTEEEEKPGIFSLSNNDNNQKMVIDNGFTRKNIFIENNQSKNKNKIVYKDSSLGNKFNGFGIIRSDKQNCIFMSISALPEYKHSSSEELRLADLEKKYTGNIILYKIRNTAIKNNIFSDDKNDNNHDNIFSYRGNNLFANNIFNTNNQLPLFNKKQNISYIVNQKLDNSPSPFVNIFNKNNNTFSFMSSNKDNKKIELNNINSNPYSFNKISNNNQLFNNRENLFKDRTYFNPNLNINQNINTINFQTNNKSIFSSMNNNDNINNYNKFTSNESTNKFNPNLDNLDINKLFSEKKTVSKVLNESIKKNQSVLDFLYDLKAEYNTSQSLNEEDNENFISEEKSLDDSNGITLSPKNFNYSKSNLSHLSPIKLKTEIPCYTMKLEKNDFCYNNLYNRDDKPYSKIEEIYKDYEKSKNDFNKKNYLGNKTYKKAYENIETNKKTKLENESHFSKTFTNGFYKNKSQNGMLLGKNEEIYKQNLMKIDKLSLNEINNNDIELTEEDKTQNKLNNLLNSNLSNKSKNSLRDSLSNISKQFVDIIIDFNLPENNIHEEIYLNEVDQLIKVKTLKEEIIQEINKFLQNRNYFNYSINKINLLTLTQFLLDKETLINYHLRSNNYKIHALIKYSKKNIIPQNLLPKLDKTGYNCIPSISELQNKTLEELKSIKDFKIYNKYGQVEFKEPINLIGVNLNEEIDIEKDMIETGDKLDYWSIFTLNEFIADENTISNLIEKININNGKFISFKNKKLVWEYKKNNNGIN